MDQLGLWLILAAVGLSLLLNVALAVVVALVVWHNKDITNKSVEATREAMDSILAVADLPAASFREEMRSRALQKLNDAPTPRQRRVMN